MRWRKKTAIILMTLIYYYKGTHTCTEQIKILIVLNHYPFEPFSQFSQFSQKTKKLCKNAQKSRTDRQQHIKIHNILKLMKNNIQYEQTIRKQYEKIKKPYKIPEKTWKIVTQSTIIRINIGPRMYCKAVQNEMHSRLLTCWRK